MYTAILLACMFDGTCIKFEDTRGPYLELTQCKTRITEMYSDVVKLGGRLESIHYKCELGTSI